MQGQRTYVLILTILLCSIPVQTGISQQQISHTISSFGAISYEHYFETIAVEFENPEDFLTPKSGPEVWASQQSWWTLRDPEGLGTYFEPATDIAHSGNQSARLLLTNPIDFDHSRMHIYHEWGDLVNETHIWFEAWYYFPPDFVVDDWTQFHTALSEKYYTRMGPVHWLACGISITLNTKVADGEYKLATIRHQGWIDEDGDGQDDLEHIYWDDWIHSNDTIKFGEWFKITTYIYRSLNETEGIYRGWLNGVLQWDIRQRTIGYNPFLVDHERWGGDGVTLVRDLPRTGGLQRVVFNSGISLYTGGHPATPKHIYVDDAMLKHLAP